jgi:hypothetical protein
MANDKERQSQIQTVEMTDLRWVILSRIKVDVKVRTREELGIYKLNDKIQQYRNQWLSHTKRMEQYRLPRHSWEYRLTGRKR